MENQTCSFVQWIQSTLWIPGSHLSTESTAFAGGQEKLAGHMGFKQDAWAMLSVLSSELRRYGQLPGSTSWQLVVGGPKKNSKPGGAYQRAGKTWDWFS